MITSPCKNCEKRHNLCHAKCPEYGEYRAKMEKRRQDRFNARQVLPARAYYKSRVR